MTSQNVLLKVGSVIYYRLYYIMPYIISWAIFCIIYLQRSFQTLNESGVQFMVGDNGEYWWIWAWWSTYIHVPWLHISLPDHAFLNTVYIGSLKATVSDTASNTTEASIYIPPDYFEQLNISEEYVDIIFLMFNSSALFPLANESRPTFFVASTVIFATVVGYDTTDISSNITFRAKLQFPVR